MLRALSKPAVGRGDGLGQGVDIGRLEAFYDERYEGDYMSGLADLEIWRTRETLRRILLPPSPRIVDYGCGRGVWGPVLRAAFAGARVVGIEISSKAVAAARLTQPEHEFVVFDGRRAPLPDGSIDLVFSYHVLEHVLDLGGSVADMARLVRDGGYVCAILPCANRGSIEELATRLVENGVERSSTGEARFFYEDPGHLRRLTSDQLTAAFAEHGCELVTELYARHLAAVSYIGSWPALVRQMFDPTRARTRRAAVLLSLMRTLLFPAAALLKTYHLGLGGLVRKLRRAQDAKSRLVCLGALLALPIALPLGHALEIVLPRREWQRTCGAPRGAVAQFLVFRKQRSSAGGPPYSL